MPLKRQVNGNILIIINEKDEVLLSIKEEMEDDAMVISIIGDLKTEVAHEFEDELMALIISCKSIIIDFSEVDFISSIGMRALLSAQQLADEMGNIKFCIRNINNNVMYIFESNGFLDLIEIIK